MERRAGLQLLLVLGCFVILSVQPGITARVGKAKAGDEDWGYVEVRPGAHMFYWLKYTTAAADPLSRPLVIWMQGGPGLSSTGNGNFEEIGPLDIFLEPRNSSWTSHVNVLFIDNPVGAGYSYVDDLSLLVKNNKEVAIDLMTFIRAFYNATPDFTDVPLYIFSQSYGGKMATGFTYELAKAIKEGEINVNLKGLALGDAFISPVDSAVAWAPYLLQTGVIDTESYKIIDRSAQKCRQLAEINQWAAAAVALVDTQLDIKFYSHDVDFNNILYPTSPSGLGWIQDMMFKRDPKPSVKIDREEILNQLMNGEIRKKLKQKIPFLAVWSGQKQNTFDALWGDFIQPVTGVVELILTNTNVTVAVYNGQLDMLVSTPGVLRWVKKLDWPGAPGWQAAPRDPLVINSFTEGYVKRFGALSMWWIDRAGHWVPFDNPEAGLRLLKEVTGYTES